MTDLTGQKALDYNTELRQGNIPGSSQVRLTATTADVGGVSRVVWNGGTEYVFNYVNIGEEWEIVSADPNDTIAGTGAQKITLIYVKSDFTRVVEEFDLNGATVTITGTDKLTVNEAFVSQIGTPGGAPAGDILVRKAGGGDLRSIIMAGINIAEDGILQVPAGFTWLLTDATPITTKGGDAGFLLEATKGENGIWIPLAAVSVYQNVITIPISTIDIEEKSLVRIVGESSQDGNTGIVELVFTQVENT